jgi:hypothetical protein
MAHTGPERRGSEKTPTPEEIAEAKLTFRKEDDLATQLAVLDEIEWMIDEKRAALECAREDKHAAQPVSEEQANLDLPEADTRTPEELIVAYEAQYSRLPDDIRSRCTFDEFKSRLTANENHYLELAVGLRSGGELVYIDEEGNPVLREGGLEPVLKGLSYNETRETLYGKEYEEGNPHYGYAMPNSVNEIKAIERITRNPFIASENGREWRETHMEKRGENSEHSWRAVWNPSHLQVYFSDYRPPWHKDPTMLGVVRMLRVKKMA